MDSRKGHAEFFLCDPRAEANPRGHQDRVRTLKGFDDLVEPRDIRDDDAFGHALISSVGLPQARIGHNLARFPSGSHGHEIEAGGTNRIAKDLVRDEGGPMATLLKRDSERYHRMNVTGTAESGQ